MGTSFFKRGFGRNLAGKTGMIGIHAAFIHPGEALYQAIPASNEMSWEPKGPTPPMPRGNPPGNSLPETNIAPKNGWLEYYFPIGKAYFQGLC